MESEEKLTQEEMLNTLADMALKTYAATEMANMWRQNVHHRIHLLWTFQMGIGIATELATVCNLEFYEILA